MPILSSPPLLERTIERTVCAYARKQGVLVTKFTAPGLRGVPDRIFWVPGGVPLLVEFKRAGHTLSPSQEYIKAKLEGLGYEVKVISDIQVGKGTIDAALGAAQLPRKR